MFKRQGRMRVGVLTAVGTAALLIVSGCASSSGSSSESAADASSSSAPAGKELLIGENTIISGTAAASFAISQGFEAYLDMVNKQGGVNGYTFKWDARDNAYSPAQSATVQTQLLALDPFAICVVGTVPVTSASQVSINAGSDVPLMVAADGALVTSIAPQVQGGIFGFVPDYTKLAPFDADFIMTTLKEPNFALAYENDSLAEGASKAVQEYVPANGGSLLATVPVPATTTDFTPLATQLKSSGATTVLAWMNAGVTAGLQKAAAQIDYKPKWVTPFFALSAGYLQLAGDSAEGTYIDAITPPTTDVSDPAVKTFVDTVTAYAPTAVSGAGQQGWQLAAVLVEGVRQASANGQELTKANFQDAVKKINGTIGMTNLDYQQQNWGATEAAMFQVQGGKFVSVAPFSKLPGL